MSLTNDFKPIPYDPNFLGIQIPFPTFDYDNTLDGKVFKNENLEFKTKFDETGQWRNYIHYSIATNTDRRQPICAASNIKQSDNSTKSQTTWYKDPAIDEEYQLNNFYYGQSFGDVKGIWDRGHVAQRAAVAWGDEPQDAREASKRSYYYTNCYPQHNDYNGDEWGRVEAYVTDLIKEDKDTLISVFTGPIYNHPDPANEGPLIGKDADGNQVGEPVEIPDAFFKVVAFMNKENEFDVRAFISLHNEEAVKVRNSDEDQPLKYLYTLETDDDLLDENGKKKYVSYAVSTKEVEFFTGLKFDEKLHVSNPMKEMVDTQKRDSTTDSVNIVISSALVNPRGSNERGREWVEIKNLGKGNVDLAGWKLSDQNRRRTPITLSGILTPNATKRITELNDENGRVILTNSSGELFLEDSNGKLIDSREWNQRPRDDEVLEFI
jgi:DNA/RNA endonuclease G (NUC1)